MAPAMFLLGIGPLARWRKASLPELAVRLRWAFAISVAGGIAIPFRFGWRSLAAVGLLLAIWIGVTVVLGFSERLRTTERHGMFAKLRAVPRGYYGMQLAHIGVAVAIVGIAVVSSYEQQKDLKMDPSETAEVGGYDFRFLGVHRVEGPNYEAERADVEVFRNGIIILRMQPEKRVYNVSGSALTNAAIDSGIFRDLYVALGEPVTGSGAWSLRIQYKPFVDWIWAGAALMALGGVIALTDRRYRIEVKKRHDVLEAA
ncbi:MAG TPA: cytochrome c-type biogenesis CcmF C-terminal domain-containing protein, partial [Terriglobia bacterium]|nr:cytochrome c-type biogenesis CcmF C-terminal domain-containing protein [Terriglobia bacterium]